MRFSPASPRPATDLAEHLREALPALLPRWNLHLFLRPFPASSETFAQALLCRNGDCTCAWGPSVQGLDNLHPTCLCLSGAGEPGLTTLAAPEPKSGALRYSVPRLRGHASAGGESTAPGGEGRSLNRPSSLQVSRPAAQVGPCASSWPISPIPGAATPGPVGLAGSLPVSSTAHRAVTAAGGDDVRDLSDRLPMSSAG